MTEIKVNDQKWNRNIINIFWMFLVLSTFIELCNIFFTEMNQYDFFIRYVLIPTGIILFFILLIEGQYYLTESLSPYTLIVCANIIASVLINVHPTVDIITALYFFPLLIALSYFKKSYILFVILLNILSYLCSYFLNKDFQGQATHIDLITTLFILLGAGFFFMKLLDRGFIITNTLLNSEKDKQELMIKNTLLDSLVKTDLLTGLYNHKTFHEYLYRLTEQHKDHPLPMQLAILDIDDFKGINDTYGHRAGDDVISQIATIIKENIDPNDFAARYGGEEFAIILLEKEVEQAFNIVEKIRCKVANIAFEKLDNKHVTISIGLNEFKSDDTKETLFNGADQQLYESKRAGKNQTRLLKAEVDESLIACINDSSY